MGAACSNAWLACAGRSPGGGKLFFLPTPPPAGGAGLAGGGVDDAADRRSSEPAAATPAAEDGIGRARGALDRKKLLPDLWLQQDRSGLAAFSEHRDLAAFLAGQGIAPF